MPLFSRKASAPFHTQQAQDQPTLKGRIDYGKGTTKFFLFEGVDAAARHEKGYYTNSIITIGAPSPRRGPSFMIRVYPP